MSRRLDTAPAGLDFGILLNVAFGNFKRALHEYLARAGFDDLGGSFGYVLRTLEPASEGLSLTELSGALAVTPQGTLKIVDDMVAKGYVARRADAQDTRVRRLTVAPRGRALLREARRFHRQFEHELATKAGTRAVASTRRVLESLAGEATVAPSIRMQIL